MRCMNAYIRVCVCVYTIYIKMYMLYMYAYIRVITAVRLPVYIHLYIQVRQTAAAIMRRVEEQESLDALRFQVCVEIDM